MLLAGVLIVQDGLRRWSADFQLRAHLLNLRCLSFELRHDNFHSLPRFLDFAMVFEELIEQHRVHLIVAHADALIWFSESGFIGVYPWP